MPDSKVMRVRVDGRWKISAICPPVQLVGAKRRRLPAPAARSSSAASWAAVSSSPVRKSVGRSAKRESVRGLAHGAGDRRGRRPSSTGPGRGSWPQSQHPGRSDAERARTHLRRQRGAADGTKPRAGTHWETPARSGSYSSSPELNRNRAIFSPLRSGKREQSSKPYRSRPLRRQQPAAVSTLPCSTIRRDTGVTPKLARRSICSQCVVASERPVAGEDSGAAASTSEPVADHKGGRGRVVRAPIGARQAEEHRRTDRLVVGQRPGAEAARDDDHVGVGQVGEARRRR